MESRRRRNRQRKACDTCRKRKSRCDVAENFPCTICQRFSLECRTTSPGPFTAAGHRNSQRESSYFRSATGFTAEPSAQGQSSIANQVQHETPPLHAETAPISDPDGGLSGLERDGLSQFFRRGVNSTNWWVFNEVEYIRLAYIGTPVSNLAHLVSLEHPSNEHLHLPYPPMRPQLPWRPSEIANTGMDSANDAACFPTKEIRDSLVDAFFEKVHPGFPIIEEAMFRRQYSDHKQPPPLLLFQAVLLAGAHVCDHPLVAKSRMVVKRTLFKRATTLFHLHHENDRLHMAQAALLFTWHLENADTVCGGTYFWLGIGSRIAFGMGLHRDLSIKSNSRLPRWERRLYRRTWWTLFQAEAFSCLEYGRPCIINLDDTDQAPLELDDFAEGEDETINHHVKFSYCRLNIQLSFIILRLLELNNPRQDPGLKPAILSAIEAGLSEFALELPVVADFWSSQIRMNYNLVLLHLHRELGAPNNPSTLPSDIRLPHSTEIAREAAHAMLSCFETMIARNWIGQCSSVAVSAVMSIAIQLTVDVRAALALGSTILAVGALERLTRLLECAKELEKYWTSAGGVYRLFEELSEELRQCVRVKPPGADLSPAQQHQESQLTTTLNDAFNFLDFEMPVDLVAEQWMNDEEIWDQLL
ncbi:unnamed protein product [Clonostachys rosea]|uniref:Zn(2)-C6 fungal-type domain-containing protein n=1 Tax=Bionectria ochroleuca TaxID=29856 RepID=A0ABY6UL04_BIOOC|nr:unnamed protein product [Clonostachys rosea]